MHLKKFGMVVPVSFDISLLFGVFSLFISSAHGLSTNDFYPHTKELTNTFLEFKSSINYPHWADDENQKLYIVNSGIIRFSGIDGLNTLDLLVLAVNPPIPNNNIYFEEKVIDSDFNKRLKNDLMSSSIEEKETFQAISAVVCTWNNVEFYSGKFSSFQIVIASNGNRTIAVIKVAKMEIPDTKLPFYPEMDLRFAYDGGTKFIRTGYLKEETGVSTATKGANKAATGGTNSGQAGRWVLDLTLVNETESKAPPTNPPPVEASQVSNSSTIGLGGQFVFDVLSLDNQELTTPGNNDEISVILSKRDADSRFSRLNKNILSWVQKVYQKGVNVSDTSVNILNYKAGSLVVEYSIQLPANNPVCSGKSKLECLNNVTTAVKETSAVEPVQTLEMKGTINEKETKVSDFDECSAASGSFCDINAYCINFPGDLSFGCKCKDGFQGDGFPGNCNRDSQVFSRNLYVVIGSGIACFVFIILFIAVVLYVKRTERTNWAFKQTAAERILPKDLRPKDNYTKKGRSTRKVMVPAPFNQDFDIYHRT